jgi:hypothetical protein
MWGAGFVCFAKLYNLIQQYATPGISPLPNSSQVHCGLQSPARMRYGKIRLAAIHALKFRLLTVAIRGAAIFLVTIRGLRTADCHFEQRYIFVRGV